MNIVQHHIKAKDNRDRSYLVLCE